MGDFNGSNYDDKIIGELVNFVASDKFQTMFEGYFLKHALEFSNEEEHKLKYYELYQNFHDLFDKQLEEFCDQLNLTQAEFMQKCRAASTEDPKVKHYISILLSSVEYETFVKLMHIMRPVAQQRLEARNSGSDSDAKGEVKSTSSPSKASAKGNEDYYNADVKAGAKDDSGLDGSASYESDSKKGANYVLSDEKGSGSK